jgi:hypothetical protein
MKRKTQRPIEGHFVAIGHELLGSPAWLAMRAHTRLVYIALLQEIRYYPDGSNNNGRVYLSSRAAGRRVNITKMTAWDSFNEMEHYGFIVQTVPGMPGKSGRAARRRLTDIAHENADGTKAAATKDYLDWDGVLYDPEPKHRKSRKLYRQTIQGPVSPHDTGGVSPDDTGESQNGHLPVSPHDTDLDHLAIYLQATPEGEGEDWQRSSKTPDERLEPEVALDVTGGSNG